MDFSNRIFWSWPNRSWPSMICCMRRKIRLRRNKKKKKEKFSRVVRGVCNGVLFLFELLLLFFLKWETGTVINGLSDWRKKISFMTWRRDGTRDQTRAKTTFEKKKLKKKKILCLSKKNPEKQSNRFYGHQHIEDERRERIYIFLRFTELYIP